MSLWSQFFTQTFHYAPLLSVDMRGDEVWGAPVAAACRVQPSTKRLVAADGSQAVSSAEIWTLAEVPVTARVWLPGEDTSDGNAARRPIRVDAHVPLGRATVDHYKVSV